MAGRLVVGIARLVGRYRLAIGELPDLKHICQVGGFC